MPETFQCIGTLNSAGSVPEIGKIQTTNCQTGKHGSARNCRRTRTDLFKQAELTAPVSVYDPNLAKIAVDFATLSS
jgi:hypothetical protein